MTHFFNPMAHMVRICGIKTREIITEILVADGVARRSIGLREDQDHHGTTQRGRRQSIVHCRNVVGVAGSQAVVKKTPDVRQNKRTCCQIFGRGIEKNWHKNGCALECTSTQRTQILRFPLSQYMRRWDTDCKIIPHLSGMGNRQSQLNHAA